MSGDSGAGSAEGRFEAWGQSRSLRVQKRPTGRIKSRVVRCIVGDNFVDGGRERITALICNVSSDGSRRLMGYTRLTNPFQLFFCIYAQIFQRSSEVDLAVRVIVARILVTYNDVVSASSSKGRMVRLINTAMGSDILLPIHFLARITFHYSMERVKTGTATGQGRQCPPQCLGRVAVPERRRHDQRAAVSRRIVGLMVVAVIENQLTVPDVVLVAWFVTIAEAAVPGVSMNVCGHLPCSQIQGGE